MKEGTSSLVNYPPNELHCPPISRDKLKCVWGGGVGRSTLKFIRNSAKNKNENKTQLCSLALTIIQNFLH